MAMTTGKCNIRGCCLLDDAYPRFTCSAPNCNKTGHLPCFFKTVLTTPKGDVMPNLPDGKIACTKTCYTAITKALSGASESGRGMWNSDGLLGKDDKNTSMKILLDWMLEEGNYGRYRGKDNKGKRKQEYATMLCETMAANTKSKDRKAKHVQAKIKYIEDTFRIAHYFATSETGAGIKNNQGDETFQDIVKRKCRYYYELCPIMADRSSTEPKFTNYNPSDLDNFSTGNYDDEEDVSETGSINADGANDIYNDDDKSYDDEQSENFLTETQPTSVIPNIVEVNEAKSTATASKHSAQKRRKKNGNGSFKLLDDDTTEMLGMANNHSQTKIDELKRHNTELEKIEKRKLEIEIKKDEREEKRMQQEDIRIQQDAWKGKNEELAYKVSLVSEYKNLKRQKWTKEQILLMFPDMKFIAETITNDDDDE